jgi:hypothetical protein
MIISFDFYWKYNLKNFVEIRNYIVNRSFPFAPKEFILDDDYSFDEGISLLRDIDEISNDEFSIIITGEANGKQGRLYLNAFEWLNDLMIKVHISVEILNRKDLDFYEQYIAIEQLLCCFIYNQEDERWQSETRISEYEAKGLVHSHLPKTRDKAGRVVVDVSKNWGRCFHLLSIKFVAGGKMFFGEKYYGIMAEAILLSNGGHRVVKEGNQLIEVDLFDVFSADYAMIRKRQHEFISNTGLFDKLEYLQANFIGYNQMLRSLGYGG